jgi:hypothetical protein
VHSELQILEHVLGFRAVVIRSAGRAEFDRKGGDHRGSVPFSCRSEDATSGNTQQLDWHPAVDQRVAGSNPA